MLLLNKSKLVYFRFGSIISGAVQSKFSKKNNTAGTKNSPVKKKHQRGSFSFLGGMQVKLNGTVFKILRGPTIGLSLRCKFEFTYVFEFNGFD